LGGFVAFDALVKTSMDATGISAYLPTSIGGMLGAFAGLSCTALVAPAQAAAMHATLLPALGWVGRWLPVFLVPVQVMLPTIQFPGGTMEAAGLLTFLAASWLGTLVLSARLSKAMLSLLPGSAMQAVAVAAAAAPAAPSLRLPAVCLLLAAALLPIGLEAVKVPLPANLEAIVGPVDRAARSGCLAALGAGSFTLAIAQRFPGHISMLMCGLATIAGAAGMAIAKGESYTEVVQRDYLTRSMESPGSGDLLLWCLGPALVSTGVQMFQYRARIQAFGPVLLATAVIMSLANIVGTAALAPALGVSPELTLAATMRCVTIPMALPTYARLCESSGSEGNVAFVALCAGISGFLGFALSRGVLSGPLAGSLAVATEAFPRGVSTGVAAHVLGAATFAAVEPEAFAWGMLGMAASGVMSSVWICSCPPVCDLVVRLARRNATAPEEAAGGAVAEAAVSR